MIRCVVIIKGVTAQSAFKGVAVVSCRLFANLGKVHMIVRMQRVYISHNRLISIHTKSTYKTKILKDMVNTV